ncbi:hypothetical protein AVEN_121983-1 [Araneus ventricosus]|uniref:Uncharacterized protein n=1 Tax=Araneus ventricosus TaxID=182803 RepID=A0A4Y2UKV6_ARAVE|nr:hypothetical protein AVEN_121983-1 [Araneus ventricosus]
MCVTSLIASPTFCGANDLPVTNPSCARGLWIRRGFAVLLPPHRPVFAMHAFWVSWASVELMDNMKILSIFNRQGEGRGGFVAKCPSLDLSRRFRDHIPWSIRHEYGPGTC